MQPRGQKLGLMLAAPSSGSGKTVTTLALLRAFRQRGVSVGAAKAGPDYIDPAFHQLACGSPSLNLDPWAMDKERLRQLAGEGSAPLLMVEAMMGLFDGAADGSGSAADLAATLNLPVVLIVDAAKQSHSIAALVSGFKGFRKDLNFAGVILNKVGSMRHETMLRSALANIGVPVFGAIPRSLDLQLPERHLGLIQAGELADIEVFIDRAAQIVAANCDLEALEHCFAEMALNNAANAKRAPILPLGQNIAVARDEAFSFIYPHLLLDWQKAGAGLSFFSPLANEAPDETADAIYLPGGYPELHCGRISAAENFKQGMDLAKTRAAQIYGECGGYMVLGNGIVDAEGARHEMLGFLNLETSFQKRSLHLGYRQIKGLTGPFEQERYRAHEFHYTSAIIEKGEALFEAHDALGEHPGNCGLRDGVVYGSYLHLIDRINL